MKRTINLKENVFEKFALKKIDHDGGNSQSDLQDNEEISADLSVKEDQTKGPVIDARQFFGVSNRSTPPPVKNDDISNEPCEEKFSPEQKQALELFRKGSNMFLTGPGGTGKTHLIHEFVKHAKVAGKNIQVCALTGCAALLLQCGASTIHSWSGIRLAKGESSQVIASVMKNRRAVKNWKSIDILIIDEVSMMSHKIFDVLEYCGRYIRGSGKSFGGIQIVFSGDFFQLGPISELNSPESGEFCFESPKWFSVFPLANHIQLKKIFRQNDPVYIDILAQVRKGKISDENIDILQKYVKKEYKPEEHNNCALTKLFPTRNRAEYVNQMMFDKIDSPEQQYQLVKKTNCTIHIESGKSIDFRVLCKCESLSHSEIEAEILQLINNSPAVPDMKLKVGCAVMCTVNIDLEMGICNGSQGVVVELVGEQFAPRVQFTNGVTLVMGLHHWQSDEYPVIAIAQYPLCLAWALTIHKIQGASLEMGQVDIGQAIFEYGQTYVALSRIRSLEGLYLSSFHANRIKAHPKVLEFYQKIDEYEHAHKTE